MRSNICDQNIWTKIVLLFQKPVCGIKFFEDTNQQLNNIGDIFHRKQGIKYGKGFKIKILFFKGNHPRRKEIWFSYTYINPFQRGTARNLHHSVGKFSRLIIFFLFFPEKRHWHFMQIVFSGDNLHKVSKPIFWKKKKKNISKCRLVKFLPRVLSIIEDFAPKGT